MIDALFVKELTLAIDEQMCIDEISNAPREVWFTARDKDEDEKFIKFVKDKKDCQFYLARLKWFPKTLEHIKQLVPDMWVANSYVTKCFPNYAMIPHVDTGRKTAIIIPLGDNKGEISYFVNGESVFTHTYNGPTLTRVDIEHSANNNSDKMRYGITIEIPGEYLINYFTRT